MRSLDKLQIVFTNSNRVYYAGQEIFGRVILSLSSEKKYRGISMKIKGKADVHWTESHTSNGKSRTESFRNSETYFEVHNYLSGSVDETLTLPAGEHSFPFQHRLPSHVPSSYEGKYGRVRYTVSVNIGRPWKLDHVTRAVFTVISPLDLNARPGLEAPLTSTKQKQFSSFCCGRGVVSMMLALPTGGFVPGEVIRPSLEIDNISKVQLFEIKLIMTELVKYHAVQKSRAIMSTVTQKVLGPMEPGKSQVWSSEALPIPALPPSNLTNCRIIDLEYFFSVVVTPSGCHRSATLSLPVTVGTIPFNRLFTNFVATTASAPQPPVGWNIPPPFPVLANNNQQEPPAYEDLPPPDYEECIFGAATNLAEDEDNEFTGIDAHYTPRYPVYRT